ncbi:HAD family hydrolase [Endozoicomonas euniceicola]|uniref:Uncharacterized protein n=1 Tax=Endozoicomonas euniceicola TaxID=1234143 RepID=A0ABY6GRS6_9GAMM|nr:hypothetical protein [Endozoicomonas euniceicola]UYM15447.1 hypothetical protein NX720_21765 [Endozoicomonas euniceicola]
MKSNKILLFFTVIIFTLIITDNKSNASTPANISADTSAVINTETPNVTRKVKSAHFFGIDGEIRQRVIIQPAILYGKVEFRDESNNKLLAEGYEFLLASATADNQTLYKHRAFALEAGKNKSVNVDNCTSSDERANCTINELLDYRASEGVNLIVDSGDSIRTYYEYNCKYRNTHSDNSGLLNSELLLDCKYVKELPLPSRVLFYGQDENSSDIISILSYFAFRKKYNSEPGIDFFDRLPPASYYMYGTRYTAKKYNQYAKSIHSLVNDLWHAEVKEKTKEEIDEEEEYEKKVSKTEPDLKATQINLQECKKKNADHEKQTDQLKEEIDSLKENLKSC